MLSDVTCAPTSGALSLTMLAAAPRKQGACRLLARQHHTSHTRNLKRLLRAPFRAFGVWGLGSGVWSLGSGCR
eukprot:524574-Rhodomonas_salina.1